MEDQLSSLTVTHLLQHTLRSLCTQEDSQWVYAVFWRILPRNFPPPKWDAQGGAYDRSRGNRRNWILVWEDGFCNFAASTTADISSNSYPRPPVVYGAAAELQQFQGLQPELFFKMSHEIYNYGEGIIGKVAADHSHKWIHKEPNEQEINFLSAWHNSADSHPRTWEAQFQSGIKTIALIAVREGVIQLGAMNKVIEDLSYVVLVRKKLSLIESIPGVLLPHPSCSAFPSYKADHNGYCGVPPDMWPYQGNSMAPPLEYGSYIDPFTQQPLMMKITPSMSSLEALLSKLPSVVPEPPPQASQAAYPEPPNQQEQQQQIMAVPPPRNNSGLELMGGPLGNVNAGAKEENEEENHHHHHNVQERELGECSSSMSSYHHQPQHQHFYYHHQDLNIGISRAENGF